MLNAQLTWLQTRPRPSLLWRGVAWGALAAVLMGAFRLSGGWEVPLGMALFAGLLIWWRRRPSAQLRKFVAGPRESVTLIVQAVRQKRNLPGLDSGGGGVVVLARVKGAKHWVVLEGVVARSDLGLLRIGQPLLAWTSPSGEVLLQQPVPGIRLGQLIEDPTPPEASPDGDTGPDGDPSVLAVAGSAMGVSFLQTCVGSFTLPLLGAAAFDPSGEGIIRAGVAFLGLAESAVLPVQLACMLISVLVIPWIWWRWLGSWRHERAWKAARAPGDGRALWARRVARTNGGEGPSYDHVWIPTDDGRILYGSIMAVTLKFVRGASPAERKAALERHMGPWIPVWSFGSDRFILNIQPGRRRMGWRGVGCLSEADDLA